MTFMGDWLLNASLGKIDGIDGISDGDQHVRELLAQISCHAVLHLVEQVLFKPPSCSNAAISFLSVGVLILRFSAARRIRFETDISAASAFSRIKAASSSVQRISILTVA